MHVNACKTCKNIQNAGKRMIMHTKTHTYTNSRENAYKLCNISYKSTQIHLYAYKLTLKMTQIYVNNHILGCYSYQ